MTREETCKNCISAKECVMYDPNMKRCKEYKEDPKEIYNKGFADGQKALAEHLKKRGKMTEQEIKKGGEHG